MQSPADTEAATLLTHSWDGVGTRWGSRFRSQAVWRGREPPVFLLLRLAATDNAAFKLPQGISGARLRLPSRPPVSSSTFSVF